MHYSRYIWIRFLLIPAAHTPGVFEFVPAAKKPPVPRVDIKMPQKLIATPANPEPNAGPAPVSAGAESAGNPSRRTVVRCFSEWCVIMRSVFVD